MLPLSTKPCAEMTNDELAAFIKSGAWRPEAHEPDSSAEAEAAKRLRQIGKQWVFARNRALGPAVILAVLIAFHFLSPYLPQEFKEFLVSLRGTR